MQLSDLGEFGFIDRITGLVPGGTSDDAAVVEVDGTRLACTIDALVEGVHFRTDWSSPSDIGWKSVAVNVSDLAAMGAEPRFLLIALGAPPDTDISFLDGLYEGINEACRSYGVELVGGDTVSAPQLVVTIAATGSLDGDPITRGGAQPGDVLAVTGGLGRAAAGVNLLLSGDPASVPPDAGLTCLEAHRRPEARVDAGRRLRGVAHAAIDVTDGLASDAIRIADASDVGVEIDAIPVAPAAAAVADARGWDVERMVLGGGEDLELLVAVPPDTDLDALGLIACGRITPEGRSLLSGGRRQPLSASGFDHFRGR